MPKCSKCSKETGTSTRYCRKHQAQVMRRKRAKQNMDAVVHGAAMGEAVLMAASLIENARARKAFIDAVLARIAGRKKR